jgi:hypothetical protein
VQKENACYLDLDFFACITLRMIEENIFYEDNIKNLQIHQRKKKGIQAGMEKEQHKKSAAQGKLEGLAGAPGRAICPYLVLRIHRALAALRASDISRQGKGKTFHLLEVMKKFPEIVCSLHFSKHFKKT